MSHSEVVATFFSVAQRLASELNLHDADVVIRRHDNQSVSADIQLRVPRNNVTSAPGMLPACNPCARFDAILAEFPANLELRYGYLKIRIANGKVESIDLKQHFFLSEIDK